MIHNSSSMNHSSTDQMVEVFVKADDPKWVPCKGAFIQQSLIILDDSLLHSMKKAYIEVLDGVDISEVTVSNKRSHPSIGGVVGFNQKLTLSASKRPTMKAPSSYNIVVANLHRSKKVVHLLLEEIVSFRVDKLAKERDQLWLRWAVLRQVGNCEFDYTRLSFWWNPLIGDREMTIKAISHDLKRDDPSSHLLTFPEGIQWKLRKI